MKSRRAILLSISKSKVLTGFEKDVYRAIAKIPRGEVRSYGWVAGQIGRPGAYRAVGSALNKNPYPVIIPCHRVVRSDGSLGGFARGPAAKRKLLEREGSASPFYR